MERGGKNRGRTVMATNDANRRSTCEKTRRSTSEHTGTGIGTHNETGHGSAFMQWTGSSATDSTGNITTRRMGIMRSRWTVSKTINSWRASEPVERLEIRCHHFCFVHSLTGVGVRHAGSALTHDCCPQRLQGLVQLVPLHRFRVHGRHAAFHPPVITVHDVGADAQDRGPPVLHQPPDCSCGVVPVHDGHVDVHEDCVVWDGRLTRHSDGFQPIRRLVDGESFQMNAHQPAVDGDVVHDQHPQHHVDDCWGLRHLFSEQREQARRLHGLGQVLPGLHVVRTHPLSRDPNVHESGGDRGVLVLWGEAACHILHRQEPRGITGEGLAVPLLTPEPLQLLGHGLTAVPNDAIHRRKGQ
mmetsp:Transcript_70548/g.117874  ORF Transcript_70548/g.117874 Transcript_70548/m.117874 type:complete len:356 (+) Transcript_70548:1172-2239(+)